MQTSWRAKILSKENEFQEVAKRILRSKNKNSYTEKKKKK